MNKPLSIPEDVARMVRERVERQERNAVEILLERAKFAAQWDSCKCRRYPFPHHAERECPREDK